jgi:hypothetical protein
LFVMVLIIQIGVVNVKVIHESYLKNFVDKDRHESQVKVL